MLNDTLLENLKTTNTVPPVIDVRDGFMPWNNVNLDSWFYICRCKTDKHDVSFLLHFIVMRAGGMEMVNTLFSVTDKKNGWYSSEDLYLPLKNQINVADNILTIDTGKARMSGNLEHIYLEATNSNCSMKLEVEPRGYVINNAGTGYFPILIMKENYQYTMPYFKTSGEMTIDGETFSAEGECWLDRQIDTFAAMANIDGGGMQAPGTWTWLGIKLNNQMSISIWDYTQPDGRNCCFASTMDEHGNQKVITIDSVVAKATDIWVSEKSGNKYPTHWTVDIPDMEMRLDIKAVPEGQEIIASQASMTRYEGESVVKGVYKGDVVNGSCCIELVGPWN